jgi:uncharacterized lipoprotein YehR (DUF1307 family)
MKTGYLKKLLLLALAAVFLVSLASCAAAQPQPKTYTEEETDTWTARCIADYAALYQKDAMHFTEVRTYKTEKSERVVSNAQIWFCGSDYLQEKINYKEIRTHAVTKEGVGFIMEADKDDSEVWTPASDPYYYFDRSDIKWEDRGYTFHSIEGTEKETKVTFYWDLGDENCTRSARTFHLEFHYQAETLSRIVFIHTAYNGSQIDSEKLHTVDTTEYIFHSTGESEIIEKIDAAYQKASGK